MKYPILKINYLPNLYKHCRKVYVFHMHIENKGFLDHGDKAVKTAYLQDLFDRTYTLIEEFYVVNLGSRVMSNDENFIIFKTSLPIKQFKHHVESFMAEISRYTNNEVIITYRILLAFLFQKDRPVKITMTNKVGDDIMDAKEWESEKHVFQDNHAPTRKYLNSYEDFISLHPNTIKTIASNKPSTSNNQKDEHLKQENDTDHDGGMYYI